MRTLSQRRIDWNSCRDRLWDLRPLCCSSLHRSLRQLLHIMRSWLSLTRVQWTSSTWSCPWRKFGTNACCSTPATASSPRQGSSSSTSTGSRCWTDVRSSSLCSEELLCRSRRLNVCSSNFTRRYSCSNSSRIHRWRKCSSRGGRRRRRRRRRRRSGWRRSLRAARALRLRFPRLPRHDWSMLCKNALLVCTVLGKRNSRSRSCATCFPSQCRTRHNYLQTTHERRNISKIDVISSARKTTEESRHECLQVRTTPSAERLLPAIMEAKEHLHHHQLWLSRRSFFSFFSSVAARFRIITPNAATHFPPEGRHTNPSIEEEDHNPAY